MALVKPVEPAPCDAEKRAQSRDCAALLRQLDAADPETRRWAARDLADCPGSTLALLERLRREEELSVREVILSTLVATADPAAVAGLVACLGSQDAALRNEAIGAMQQLPDQVAPIMGGLLRDPDPDVRIFAVNILQSLCHPDVEGWLIGVIEGDHALNVCATAVDLLGEVGTTAAFAPLERLKARFADEPYVAFAVELALKRIGST